MQNSKRAGFTLVELMVAMALTLFVMVILTQAFATSLDTFSAMKGIGDMQQNLRTAGNILRSDLSQDHLEGKRRLSDLSGPNGTAQIVAQPPQAGFVAVMQESLVGTPGYVNEGVDSNGLPSYRANNHVLYLTIKRKGNRQENFFTTPLLGTAAELGSFFGAKTAYDVDPAIQLPYFTLTPPYVAGSTSAFYSSQWAEVVYFLMRTGSTEEPNNPASGIGTPTFGLYRAQFVMVPDSTNVNTLGLLTAATQTGTFGQMSTSPTLLFNSPSDAATIPGRRVIPNLTPAIFQGLIGPPGGPAGDVRFQTSDVNGATQEHAANLVLPNVISFHVQIMPTGAIGTTVFEDIPLAAAGAHFRRLRYDKSPGLRPAGHPGHLARL